MRTAEAEALLRRALARNPYHARAHLLLGQVLAKRGAEFAAEAEREVRCAERVSPQHRDVLELVGNYAAYRAVETGESRYVDWAVEAFRSLHRLEPEAVARTIPILRLFLERTDELARAIPDEVHPRLQFASCLMGMGRTDDAMAEYRRADALDPSAGASRRHEGEGRSQEGRLLVWRGEWQRGAASLLEARSILGDAFADSAELARALLRSGRVADAERPFVAAMRSAERGDANVDLLLEDVRAMRAFDPARGWVAEAFPGAGGEARRSYLRGRLFLLEGELSSAKDELLRSLRGEKDPRVYALLARLSLQQGDFDAAASWAERALLYDPSNATYASLVEESRRRAFDTTRKES
jgi:tetratricopeptide (TPR) repeat protein